VIAENSWSNEMMVLLIRNVRLVDSIIMSELWNLPRRSNFRVCVNAGNHYLIIHGLATHAKLDLTKVPGND